MIQLTRERTAQAIPAAFRGPARKKREITLLTSRREWMIAGGTGTFDLKSSLWRPIKKQLVKESGEKCGYCEASSVTVCHCDVEHIRPKSIYWWLALCVDNYVLACQLCNQTHKGDQYPLRGPQLAPPALAAGTTDAALAALADTFAPDPIGPAVALAHTQFLAEFTAERPGLINPYLDTAERFFIWEPDAIQHEVAIKPRAASGERRWRAEQSIEVLKLNREELRRARWKIYRPIALGCRIDLSGRLDADPALKAEQKDVLIAAMEKDQFFSGMLRWTIREEFGLAL